MRFQAVWLLDCGHERGFTRPEDEPSPGDEGRCWLCPAVLVERGRSRLNSAPVRTYVRKVQ